MTNPAADADFYGLEQLLDDAGQETIRRTREFMTKEVELSSTGTGPVRSSRTS